jgi:hypothetical protein
MTHSYADGILPGVEASAAAPCWAADKLRYILTMPQESLYSFVMLYFTSNHGFLMP